MQASLRTNITELKELATVMGRAEIFALIEFYSQLPVSTQNNASTFFNHQVIESVSRPNPIAQFGL